MDETSGKQAIGYIFDSVFLFLIGIYSFEAFLNYSYRILKKRKEAEKEVRLMQNY